MLSSHHTGAARLGGALCFVAALSTAGAAAAQEHQHAAPAAGPGWAWTWEAHATVGANLQERKFTDFRQVESQNWFMLGGARAAGAGTVRLHGMFSLEPFTLRRLGSAQVFQTGETLDGAPLIDYQHPHDLFMALEATYERPAWTGGRVFVRAAPVGEAAFGPAGFMHRASAAGNPTAPLSHHQLDSTHISRSVVTAGVAQGAMTFEGSAFKGREPDEDRLDVDLGAPDSLSARFKWRRPNFGAQVSGARVRDPEVNHPGDVTRLSASIDGTNPWRGSPAVWTLAYGRNIEPLDRTNGLLFEAAWYRWDPSFAYVRIEVTGRHILPSFVIGSDGHSHTVSTVGAVTAGYEHQLPTSRVFGRLAIGGDVTVHAVPHELTESYGSPVSIHFGIRYRARK